jgi:hypothetical protein
MPFLDDTGLKRVWSKMLDKTHPVGSLYWSSNSTNPGKLFGGTWVQIKDKFILAAGDKYGNGTTGGSADAVVVSHTHSIPKLTGKAKSHGIGDGTGGQLYTGLGSKNFGVGFWNGGNSLANYWPFSAGEANSKHEHDVETNASTTGSQGVSGAGKNMPPYETYYCWKRTA